MRARNPAQAARDPDRIGFLTVLRVRTFLTLYVAETQSELGDQLARVALSALIYSRTGSAAETALTYALTFLPAILGGGVLSGLADKYPRRIVLIVVDVVRAGLVATMAVPGLPLWTLFALLVVAVFLGPAFYSAEVSFIASILDGDYYRVATGLRMMTSQVAQVVGFAAGGALVAVFSPRWALGIDAATFAISSLLVGFGTRHLSGRGTGRHRSDDGQVAPTSLRASILALWRDGELRALIGLSWLAAFFVAPEGLAAPYAHQIGAGTSAIGILLAAIPLGSVVGAFIVLRAVRHDLRVRLIGPMAVLAGLPLIVCANHPGLGVSLTLWCLSGVFGAYQLDAITALVQRIGDTWRGRAVSLLGAGLTAMQGLGLIAFGIVAQLSNAGSAIGVAGAVGSGAALVLWISLHRAQGRMSADNVVDAIRPSPGPGEPETVTTAAGTEPPTAY
jgi:Major Facilitator Superfamily